MPKTLSSAALAAALSAFIGASLSTFPHILTLSQTGEAAWLVSADEVFYHQIAARADFSDPALSSSRPILYFSKLANVFARWVLNVDISDLTNGYRAYRRKTAAAIELSQIRSSGYIVLSSVAYQLLRKGFRIVELPSVFVNRTRGQSNFSLREIEDAFLGILKLRFLS